MNIFPHRLWQNVTIGLQQKNLNMATDEKTRIENEQRNDAKARAAENIEWKSRFFNPVDGDAEKFLFKYDMKEKGGDASAVLKHYQDLIFAPLDSSLSKSSSKNNM